MPELPEVETIKRQLARKIVGKKLGKRKVIGLRRRAKLLIIDFDGGSSLIIHLKLTGQLVFNGQPNSHTRHIFKFSDNSYLLFNDARKFGWWKIVKNSGKIEKKFGPEALQISFAAFKTALARRPKSKIKPLLMDQKFIAGIGNIYADEILFSSRTHPLRLAGSLSDKEIKAICRDTSKILKKAIRHKGSSVQHYVDACGKRGDYRKLHKVYHRDKEKCFRCGEIIKRIKLGSRSAHFCPACQKI